MNGFIIVGLLGVIVLAVFLWLRGRKRRPGALPTPPQVLGPRSDAPAAPTKPLYQMREGGDGGGNG